MTFHIVYVQPTYFLFMCVLCICVCVHLWMRVYMYMCMWKQEVDSECFLFALHLIYCYFVYMYAWYVCWCTCHTLHVNFRGQLCETGFPFSLLHFFEGREIELRLPGLCGETSSWSCLFLRKGFSLTLSIANSAWLAGQLAHGIDLSLSQPQCCGYRYAVLYPGASGLSWGPHTSVTCALPLSSLPGYLFSTSADRILCVKYSIFIRSVFCLLWPRSRPVLKL